MTERNWVLLGRESSAKVAPSILRPQFLLHRSPSALERLSSINRLNDRINDRINGRDGDVEPKMESGSDGSPPSFRKNSAMSAFERNSTTASFIDNEDSTFGLRASQLVDESFQFIDTELNTGGPFLQDRNNGSHTSSSSEHAYASLNIPPDQRFVQQRDSDGEVCAVFERRADGNANSLSRWDRVQLNDNGSPEAGPSHLPELPPSEETLRTDYFTYRANGNYSSMLPRDSIYYDKCDVCCTYNRVSTDPMDDNPCRVCSTLPSASRYASRLNPVYEEDDGFSDESGQSAPPQTSNMHDMHDVHDSEQTVVRRPAVTIEPYYGPHGTSPQHLSVGNLAKRSNYSDVTTASASPSPGAHTNGLITSETFGNARVVRIADNELRTNTGLSNKERTRRNMARNRRVVIVVLAVMCILALIGTGIVFTIRYD